MIWPLRTTLFGRKKLSQDNLLFSPRKGEFHSQGWFGVKRESILVSEKKGGGFVTGNVLALSVGERKTTRFDPNPWNSSMIYTYKLRSDEVLMFSYKLLFLPSPPFHSLCWRTWKN